METKTQSHSRKLFLHGTLVGIAAAALLMFGVQQFTNDSKITTIANTINRPERQVVKQVDHPAEAIVIDSDIEMIANQSPTQKFTWPAWLPLFQNVTRAPEVALSRDRRLSPAANQAWHMVLTETPPTLRPTNSRTKLSPYRSSGEWLLQLRNSSPEEVSRLLF